MSRFSRRTFVQLATAAAGVGANEVWLPRALASTPRVPLMQFGYGDVDLHSALHETQLRHHLDLLMNLSEDSVLKPLRQMSGLPSPGEDLGGWYSYDPADTGIDGAYAPGCTFGQWVSALSRMYAITGDTAIRDKVLRLNRLYAPTVNAEYYDKNRFPAYCYDKLTCGLLDSHRYVKDASAFDLLHRTADAALPAMPGRAVDNGVHWRTGKDSTFDNDEAYTVPENQFLAYQQGAGERYRQVGIAYLAEGYFGPLSEGRSSLGGRHAYSYINSLSSAMQAYFTLGEQRYLRAARNGFSFLAGQSFATGGWGPNETLQAPGSADLYESLAKSHNSFETPCGSYAHFKLTRYLLRVTSDSLYGDSMERMMYNTILGAMPIQPDGRTFYYADCNNHGHKVYSSRRWPCCSGTLPQVAADYRINAYFHDAQGVYVNLFIPSTVRWVRSGGEIAITQSSHYPSEGQISFTVQCRNRTQFALRLRIPAWAEGARIAVNGRHVEVPVVPGTFTTLLREWKPGDRVELELPLNLRLEAIDANHPGVVALMAGPLVLFAAGEGRPQVSRSQLLAAMRTPDGAWEVPAAGGPLRMLPFTSIRDEAYSTYLDLV